MGISSRRPMAGPPGGGSARARVGALGGGKGPRVGIAVVATLLVAGVVVLSARAPDVTGPSADASQDPSAPGDSAAAVPSVRPVPGHEVYAFVPYWEIDGTIAAHLAASDVSTVALFSVTNTSKGALATTQNGYKRITGPIGRQIIAEAHGRQRRVDVTFTSFGGARNDRLFGDVGLQDKVIASLVKLRASLGVDGVAVDVEELDDLAIPAYAGFIGRLRSALRVVDPEATVTVTTTSGPQGAAVAAAANLAGADRIFLMGYDYRTGSSEPGATAPLDRLDGNPRTLAWSLDLYAAAGIPSTRLLLGLPLYGVAWPVASPDLGAPATGEGAVWIPRQNLATLHDPSSVPVVDPTEGVAFLAVRDGTAWRAVYYDTPATLGPKLGLADERGLAGAGLWALGYDRGLPGYQQLLSDFRAGRLDPLAPATP